MGAAHEAFSILHISSGDGVGGSARASYRIHRGLRDRGFESRMLVGTKSTDDPDVAPIAGPALKRVDATIGRAFDRLSYQSIFYPSSFLVRTRAWYREADLLQLYNTVGYFSHTALPLLTRNKPTVWRLSDMWAFSGHCIYSYGWEGWKTGCGDCPTLSHYPALRRDTTPTLWKIKRRAYGQSSLHIVAPSKWMLNMVEQSPLLSRFPSHLIPNGLDETTFAPQDADAARASLGLPPDKRLVLFVSQFVHDHRKGWDLLEGALDRLVERIPDLEAVVVGEAPQGWTPKTAMRVHHLGSIANDDQLARVYSACDVLAFPTLAENLPNTVLECLACGTPVVAFDVGGVGDVIAHEKNGYLTRPGDVGDLAEALARVLEDRELAARMGTEGRRTIVDRFTESIQADRFTDLYGSILGPRGGGAS